MSRLALAATDAPLRLHPEGAEPREVATRERRRLLVDWLYMRRTRHCGSNPKDWNRERMRRASRDD